MHTSDETTYDLAAAVVEKLSAANKTISFADDRLYQHLDKCELVCSTVLVLKQ